MAPEYSVSFLEIGKPDEPFYNFLHLIHWYLFIKNDENVKYNQTINFNGVDLPNFPIHEDEEDSALEEKAKIVNKTIKECVKKFIENLSDKNKEIVNYSLNIIYDNYKEIDNDNILLYFEWFEDKKFVNSFLKFLKLFFNKKKYDFHRILCECGQCSIENVKDEPDFILVKDNIERLNSDLDLVFIYLNHKFYIIYK